MSDYGINMNVSMVTDGEENVKLGYKVQDTNGLNLSNKITGNIDEVTDKVKTDMINGIAAAMVAQKKAEEERLKMKAAEDKAKNTANTSANGPAQGDADGNSLVERLRRLEEQNRQLRQQLDDMKVKDTEETRKIQSETKPKRNSFMSLDSDFDKFIYGLMKRRFLDF